VVLALDVEHLVLRGAAAGRHQALCKQPWSGGIMVTCIDSVCSTNQPYRQIPSSHWTFWDEMTL
jgi:hypothetical protein